MIETLCLVIGFILMTILAIKDYKAQEYELVYLIAIGIISISILAINYSTYTNEDIFVLGFYCIMTIVLILIKQVGIGDLAIIFLFIVAPFNAALSLFITSLLLLIFGAANLYFQNNDKKILEDFPILKAPYPFITFIFIIFVAITISMYLSEEVLFWNICDDLRLNNETFHCTFIMEEYGIYNSSNPNNQSINDFSFDIKGEM